MPDCDHGAMKTDGGDFATACPGCSIVLGKFTCTEPVERDGQDVECGLVYTTKEAFDSHLELEHPDEA